MNAILYYGKGNCSIEGNVDYIKIKYRGAILIDSKLPSNYIISLGKNEIIIESQSQPYQLNDLFDYIGEFKILSVYAENEQGEKVYIAIKRVMDYTELINTKSEDMTIKSEDLNAGYVHLVPVKKTRIKGKIRR